jgi:predicted deacetylase
MRYVIDLDPHQIYSLIGNLFLILCAISLVFFIFIRKNSSFKFLNKSYNYFHKNPKKVKRFFLIFALIFLLGYLSIQGYLYALDKSTTVFVDEKIVLIELDDYWNFNDTSDYYGGYGYTFEKYRAVSDLIDKYDFVATLGVTPYIFVESILENAPLINDVRMIDYLNELKDKGYELGMHGYNHCRNPYYCPKYEEVWYNILNGKRDLENLFEIPFSSYFPPGNEWTTEQYENVIKAGFKLIGNTHVSKAYFDDDIIITNRGYDPIYHYGWHAKDFRHTSVDEWIDAYDERNLFIIQLHPNTFDSQEKLDDLDIFLSYVKEDGAKVMTYSNFYDYIDERDGLIHAK